jgi:hypothetical protein
MTLSPSVHPDSQIILALDTIVLAEAKLEKVVSALFRVYFDPVTARWFSTEKTFETPFA